MKEISFEWNENKNKINQTKHHISFEEAVSVFDDDYAVLFDDPDHSGIEERFLILGISKVEKLCMVSHCYRGKDSDIIRIISARKATKKETDFYNKWRRGDKI